MDKIERWPGENSGRMNPEAKARWIADLRTPGLKQGYHRLTSFNLFGERSDCCLGRLCSLVVPAEQQVETKENTISYFGAKSYLPKAVQLRYGIPEEGEIAWPLPLKTVGEEDTISLPNLADLNDAMFTFPQIADVIEFFL